MIVILYSERMLIEEKGNGQFSIDLDTKVKNWGSLVAFSVYAHIYPRPFQADDLRSLANDQFELIPKSNK